MKKILLKITYAFLVTIMLFGCEKFLAEDPRGLLTPINFYNSDNEVKLAVNGTYVQFSRSHDLYKGQGNSSSLPYFYQWGSDEINNGRLAGGGYPYSLYIFSEGVNESKGTWRDLYNIIQNCNALLSKIEDNDKITESCYKQSRGEVLFVRALAYYHLTNIWGNVPYYREGTSIDEIMVLGRFDKNQIQLDMIEDLKEAQTLLPDIYPDSERGRATKWVAATLMAKFFMVRSDWQGMRDKSIEIINNSWHKLLDDYGAIFNTFPLEEYNDEIIFSFSYVIDVAKQTYTDNYNPRLADEPKVASQRNALKQALSARDEGFTGYGQCFVTPEMIKTYPADDLRRPWNIITNYLGFELKYAYIPKLWNLHQINSPRANHGDNLIVYRLADIYLMAAEAENELNGPANAYQYVNKVRERAYDPDKPLSGLNKETFRQAVRDERKWELFGENHRRLDLIRWGILVETIKNTEFTALFAPANTNIKPHHVLWPIPVEEFNLNPALLESDPSNNGYR